MLILLTVRLRFHHMNTSSGVISLFEPASYLKLLLILCLNYTLNHNQKRKEIYTSNPRRLNCSDLDQTIDYDVQLV